MKHDKLMTYPKRFCATCDSNQFVYAVQHKKYVMYHCQKCKQEVARAGDGQQPSISRRVSGGLDVNSFAGAFLGGKSSEVLASEYPDVLSDEHRIWHERDFDVEEEQEDRLRTFKAALSGLTARQILILQAVDKHQSHDKAAAALGIERSTVSNTIDQIRKKLSQSLDRIGGPGLQGKDTVRRPIQRKYK